MSQCTLTLFHYISSLDFYIPLAQINIEHELVCLSLTAFQISRGRQFPHHVRLCNEPPSVSSTTNEGFPNPSWLCTFLRKRPSYPSSSMTSTRAMYNSLGLRAFLLSTLVITKSPSTIFIIRWLVGIIINQFLPIVKIRRRIRWLYWYQFSTTFTRCGPTGEETAVRLRHMFGRQLLGFDC